MGYAVSTAGFIAGVLPVLVRSLVTLFLVLLLHLDLALAGLKVNLVPLTHLPFSWVKRLILCLTVF